MNQAAAAPAPGASIREAGPNGKLPEQLRSPELERNSEKAEEARHDCFKIYAAKPKAPEEGVAQNG